MDELSTVLDRAAATHLTDSSTRQLRERLRLSQGLGSMIGRAPEMEKLYRILSKVAVTSHPVLILGESGTGKELVARTIHAYGPNSQKPFLPVDCGSLVPTLIESELFGYVKGAFTGANRSKDGLLVSAEGGTVFLDEIGELSLDLQAKLLRALQEKEVRPVGATHRIPIKARIGGDQPRPGRDGGKGNLPQGPVLPAERGEPAAALAARPPGRHTPAGRALSGPDQPRARAEVQPE
jgi:two-component system response regulator HydG